MTWSVHRFCSSSRSFTSRFQICHPTNIHWVPIQNPLFSLNVCPYITATQWISVRSQIWKREMKERLQLHNLHIDHVTIQAELHYFMPSKVVGTMKMEPRSSSNPPENCELMSSPGNNLALVTRFWLLRNSWSWRRPSGQFQPRLQPGYSEPLLTLPCHQIWDVNAFKAHTSLAGYIIATLPLVPPPPPPAPKTFQLGVQFTPSVLPWSGYCL